MTRPFLGDGDERSRRTNEVNSVHRLSPSRMRGGLAHRKRRSVLAAFRLVAVGALALGLLLASVSSPIARDLSAAERQALNEQILTFEKALRENDYDTVVGTIPPKLMAAIAAKAGIPADQLKRTMIAQMKQVLVSAKFLTFRLDSAGAIIRQAADGTPYVIVPTSVLMEIDDRRLEVTSSTLGFMDEGRWYLLRLENPGMMAILQQAYPFLTNVEIPHESRRTVK
jgi:hypothetical protein